MPEQPQQTAEDDVRQEQILSDIRLDRLAAHAQHGYLDLDPIGWSAIVHDSAVRVIRAAQFVSGNDQELRLQHDVYRESLQMLAADVVEALECLDRMGYGDADEAKSQKE